MNGFASLCIRYAAWLMRHERSDWARTMRAEFHYVSASDRLSWAFGCVIAAIKQRLVPMNTGDLRISRWVMLIEALGCFGPQVLGWYLLVFDQPGIIHYSVAEIERWYLPQPGGLFIVSMLYVGAIVGLIGPIGLFFGLRYVLTGRALDNTALGAVLIGAPIALTLGGWIAGVLVGPPDFRPMFDVVFVFTFLPVAVIAHLMYLARRPIPAARTDDGLTCV
jgi:hypothetical protein